MKNILRFFRLEEPLRNGLFSVNSLSESGFVSWGATAFEIFRRGVSPVEAVPGELRVSGRRMDRRLFSLMQIKRRAQREDLASSNRPPRFRIRADSERVPGPDISSGLFCFPGKRFHRLELGESVCDPAVLLLLSLQDSLGGSRIHVEKFGVSFEYGLALSVIGQHYSYCRILFEVTIASRGFVYSEIEDPVNSQKVRRGEVRSAVRSHCSCKS